MLARVAESLYWIGRNIERYEHCARYMQVQYFSTLDAPMSLNKDFTLRSILFMSGSSFDTEAVINENDVWRKVIFDHDNSNSLFRTAQNARENARSIRNNISSELWEAINKWYLYNKSINQGEFSSSSIFSFSENTILHLSLIKSALSNTILHDNVWNFINSGMYIERSLQIIRILQSKISDSIILSNNGTNIPLLQYQWTTMLKSFEVFDVYKLKHKTLFSKATIFELILGDELFPRSLIYSINKLTNHFERISVRPEGYEEVLHTFTTRMELCRNFKSFDDEESVLSMITEISEALSSFHDDFQNLFFNK